jgi:PAS domain S-box-containing protein
LRGVSGFLERAIDVVPDLVFVKDRRLKYVLVNKAVCDFLRRPKDEILGRTAYDLYPKDMADSIEETDREAFEKSVSVDSGEVSLRDGNGVTRVFHTKKTTLKDAGDTPTYLIAISRDVTEYRRAEEALRASERRFRAVFNDALEGIYQSTPDGRFLTANPALVRMLGYGSETELVDADIPRDIYFTPEDRGTWIEKIEKEGEVRNAEFVLKRRDGQQLIVLDSSHVVRDEQGRVLYYEGTLTDITERKRMEEKLKRYSEYLEELVEERTRELRASERSYRQLVENAAEGIWAVDVEERTTFVNKRMAEIMGYTIDEMIGKPLFSLLHPTAQHSAKTGFGRKRQDITEREEFKTVRKDGTEAYVSFCTSPILDDEERFVGTLACVTDITESKRMEEQLRQKERLAAIGEMAAMVGHDLRNPLTGISGAVYILREKYGPMIGEKGKEMLGLIDSGIEYSNKIVNDLLDYSGELRLERTKSDAQSIIQGALSMVDVPKNIRVIGSIGGKVSVTVDEGVLKRAFVNLIKNAVEAMPDGGTLTIAGKESNGTLEISFIDTGVGMTKEAMERIWRPFFTTKAKGMGFGLPICKRIVEAHGGSISAESTVGTGSVFKITLPVAGMSQEGSTKI